MFVNDYNSTENPKISGTYMYANKIRNSRIKYGKMVFDTAPIETFVMPLATNKLTAIGGVIMPIEVLTIIIKPRTIGSTPSATAIGNKIGVTSKIIDCVSRKQPRNSNSKFIMNKITYLLLNAVIIVVDKIVGIFSVVINQLKGALILMMNMTTAELTQLSAKIL